LQKLEDKQKEMIKLKLKNEQLREKELYARLQLDSGHSSRVGSTELKQEVIRQAQASKEL